MEGDSNEGDINSGCDPDTRSDLDLAFNTRLDPEGLVHEWYGPAIPTSGANGFLELTMVAEIPG